MDGGVGSAIASAPRPVPWIANRVSYNPSAVSQMGKTVMNDGRDIATRYALLGGGRYDNRIDHEER